MVQLNDSYLTNTTPSNPEGFTDPAPAVVANSGPVGIEPYTGVNKEKPVPTYAIPSPVVVPEVIA